MKSYRCQDIARLSHELTLSPARHRLRQLSGIARAIELIDPQREYPYSFVCFHITGYRSRRPNNDDAMLDGKNLIEDLVDLADALSASHPMPAAALQGRPYDIDALSQRFKVSTKTISRWRRRGLLGCWYAAAEGEPKLIFSSLAVQRFVGRNLDLVKRGSSFRLMDEQERARIIARARELVATEKCTLHAVTLRLAEETGRAVETIRYSLRRFDRDNPQQALFDQSEMPQQIDEADVIYQAFVDGEALRDIAERLGKRESDLKRILTRVRAERLAASPIEYIHNASFDDDESLLPDEDDDDEDRDDLDVDEDPTLTRVPSQLPPYLQELYRTPLLNRASEVKLFRRMNYVLHKAELARRKIAENPTKAGAADIAQVDDLLVAAQQLKNRITQANLRLVVSIAKRHLAGRNASNLFELVSDGNLALMRAVEKFDYARGFRFSTYASWAIMRSFARSVPEEMTQVDRFRTGHEEVLASIRDHRATAIADSLDSSDEQLQSTLAGCLAKLDSRERAVVERHFGLNRRESVQTLDEIGRQIGVSKERVRQIELRALQKLRTALGANGAELLAG